MKSHGICYGTLMTLLFCTFGVQAQDNTSIPSVKSQTYVLAPNDVVQIKVYQEDDLETKARVGQDGTISFPLIGVVHIGGKTVEQAGALIREKIDKDYLVNPQITLIVGEYSQRRVPALRQEKQT